MRYVLIAAIVAGLGVVGGAEPKEAAFTSKTFQDILGRVMKRDKETDAILKVKPKEDAPATPFGLEFSIRPGWADDSVDIVIYLNSKTDCTYERYVLKADDAIRKELGNQKRLATAKEKARKQYVEEQTRRIPEQTGGKLKYGMTREQVEAVMGKPSETNIAQAKGSFGLSYPDMNLNFRDDRLVEIHLTKKEK